jgi:hypothetical protein
MKLVGSNPSAHHESFGLKVGKSNYFSGNENKGSQTARQYERVLYKNVYPGIDLTYYGNHGRLEYDFIVRPGVDPRQIKLQFEGVDAFRLDAKGNILLKVGTCEIPLMAPMIYEKVRGDRKLVRGGFVLEGQGLVRFCMEGYDKTKTLVIDPILEYSTYLGGTPSNDNGNAIAVDSSGNAYITGITLSPDFPIVNAFQTTKKNYADCFVTKINASGTAVIYSTFLGGNGVESGLGIAIDAGNCVYITGYSTSTDFPTVNPFQGTYGGGMGDGFVAKLDSTGSQLLNSSYIGGSLDDLGTGIAVDGSGNYYVTGFTKSVNFPILNPIQSTNAGNYDVFVTKFNSVGGMVYSTYIGGSKDDSVKDIAIDTAGNAYVNGQTWSYDYPTKNAFQNVNKTSSVNQTSFVTKVNAAGTALIYSTYLGGSGSEWGNGIAVDASGNAYVTGYTSSSDFPVVNAAQATAGGDFDIYITKFNPTGTALVYSTFYGGGGNENGADIAVDSAGNACIVGYSDSNSSPMLNAIQSTNHGDFDIVVLRLNSSGTAFLYSTYLGGTNADRGSGIAVDASGNAYIAGTSESSDFPLVNPIKSSGSWDAVIFKINNTLLYTPTPLNTRTPTLTPTATPTITATASSTATKTSTFANTPTSNLTIAMTKTPTSTDTVTQTPSPTFTLTSTVTATPSSSPTGTSVVTMTFSPTPSFTPSDTTVQTHPLHLWPNPFKPSEAVGGRLKCAEMPQGSTLCIFSVSGEKVFARQEKDRRVEWDGKTIRGVSAAIGVYYYYVRLENDILLKGVLLVKDR